MEQCVEDLCSVPRGGVEKKKGKEKSVEDRSSSVSRTSTLRHEVA